MKSILLYNSVNIENISFKKKISNNNDSYIIPIKYEKNDLYIQTPTVLLPFGISNFKSNKYIDISFVNIKKDKEIYSFLQFIKKINKYILEYLDKKDYDINKTYIDSIKPSSYIFPERLRLNLNYSINYYDSDINLLSEDDITPKTLAKLLICPSHAWINKDSFGIYWNVLQVKTYGKQVIKEYYFINDSPNDQKKEDIQPKKLDISLDLTNNPKYGKYIKMKKMGIPEGPIKQKIQMDNPTDYQTMIKDMFGEEENSTTNNKNITDKNILHVIKNDFKKDLDKPKLISKAQIMPKMDTGSILSGIKAGVKLNSVKERKLKPKVKDTRIPGVPTLWDIKNQLKGLKKTNYTLK